MGREAQHDEVVAGLYEAALYPDRRHGALSSVMQQVGADTFHFLGWDRRDATTALNIFSHDWMSDGVQQYANYYGAIDPRRQLTDEMPVGSVLACHRHFSNAAVSRNEFYQDFLIPGGQRYVLISKLASDERGDVVIGLMREAGNKPFDDSELDRAQQLVPHLSRASRLWTDTQTLRTAAAFGAQAAQATAFALIGLDGAGKLAYANGQAERLLKDGDCLVGRNGGIGAAIAEEDLRLHRVVREVRQTGCGASLALSGLRSGPRSMLLSVAPLSNTSAGTSGSQLANTCVLITARSRKDATGVSPRALAQSFGLTPAESAVALALCEGKTPEEHAHAAGVSVPTVRAQLRSIFEKTQTRRQAEIVGLLLRTPVAGD